MKEYKVKASSLTGTYNAGRFIASSSVEACQMARDEYANSQLGRALKDVNGFRFYVAADEPKDE